MPKVSVIIPVYKVEKYLKICLDSVINQTFGDIEIICINDASPDSSGQILESYATRDKRIRIISHEKNQGLGAARNTGILQARADYIAFVDSDDYVNPEFVETLFNLIILNDAQMSWCGMNTVSETGDFLDSNSLPDKTWSTDEILQCEKLYPSILSLCNKMFHRDLIKDITQLPIISEDQPVLGEYFIKCNVIVTTSLNLYQYRQNTNTLSKPLEVKPIFWNDFFYSHELFFGFLKTKYQKKRHLRKQAILRHFSMLWRIWNYNILFQNNWDQHEKIIRSHLKADKIGLKHYSSVAYYCLKALFNSGYSKKFKKTGIETIMRLSRGKWLIRTNWLLLPFDILVGLKPTLIAKTKFGLDVVELLVIKIISVIYKKLNNKHIWLIGERPDTAQDNGIYFYSYLRSYHPEIKAYYIINKKSPQFEDLENKDKAIQANSLKHKVFFLSSSIYACSHNHFCFPIYYFSKKRYKLLKSTTNVFLQHGITFNDNSDVYGKSNSSINLFICGAQKEFEFVKREFGYAEDEVKYTGFARFDGLHNFNTKRQILVMPTWRRKIWESRLKNNNHYFLQSTYFKVFQSLFENCNLHFILERYNFTLLFYPHYEIQPYLSFFTSSSNKIVFASKEDFNVQDILKSSALLITDNSSVSFDFAYMYKPIIYYFFDKDDFTKNHLNPGYFSHDKMGFGNLIYNEEALIREIENILSDNCRMIDKYKNRVNDFFQLHDTKNCERLFHAIKTYA